MLGNTLGRRTRIGSPKSTDDWAADLDVVDCALSLESARPSRIERSVEREKSLDATSFIRLRILDHTHDTRILGVGNLASRVAAQDQHHVTFSEVA